jgi:hypothetical protein
VRAGAEVRRFPVLFFLSPLGGSVLFFNKTECFCMASLCVSQQGEFKNTTFCFGGSPCRRKPFAEKTSWELEPPPPLSFSPFNCFIAFLAFSLRLCVTSPKTPQGRFLKPEQKIPKILQTKDRVGRYVGFWEIFLWRFCAFLSTQQGEFTNTINIFCGKSMSKTFGRRS